MSRTIALTEKRISQLYRWRDELLEAIDKGKTEFYKNIDFDKELNRVDDEIARLENYLDLLYEDESGFYDDDD